VQNRNENQKGGGEERERGKRGRKPVHLHRHLLKSLRRTCPRLRMKRRGERGKKKKKKGGGGEVEQKRNAL